MKTRNKFLAAIAALAMGWAVTATAEIDYGSAEAQLQENLYYAGQSCQESEDYTGCVSATMKSLAPYYFWVASVYDGEYWNAVYVLGPSHPTTIYYGNLRDTAFFIGAVCLEF